MLKLLIGLCVAISLANACVIDVWKPWGYRYLDLSYDAATTNMPLNDNYNCFDFCAETGIAMASVLVKPSGNDTHTLVKRLTMAERNSGQLDFDPNMYTCIDGALRAAIQQSLNQLTRYTAKAIATTLQYSLNKPGWVINVIKHDQFGSGPGDYLDDTNFCEYNTIVQGEYVTIQMALVDTNPQL